MAEFDGPPGEDPWTLWYHPYAGKPSGVYKHKLVEVWRPEWGNETGFWNPAQVDPCVNVWGLYWRPA